MARGKHNAKEDKPKDAKQIKEEWLRELRKKEKEAGKNKPVKISEIIVLIFEIALVFSIIHIGLYLAKGNMKPENMTQTVLENTYIDITEVTEVKTERMLQLEAIQQENGDIVAWLEIEGTYINNPVLQTTDNDYYLQHDYKKQEDRRGSLVLDTKFDLTLPSTNFLIYGHNNTRDHTMFEDLKYYKDKKYCEEHPMIRLTTNEEDANFEIIAVFLSEVHYQNDENAFKYYYFINAETKEEYDEFIRRAKEESLYETGKTAEYGEQLLTLSTCDTHTKDGRLAIVAKKISKNSKTEERIVRKEVSKQENN